MKKNYQNKYISILGDSISTLSGYSRPDDAAFYDGMRKFEADVFAPEDTWWGQVIEALGAKLLVNNSFSGSMVCRRPGCIYPSYGCSDERTGDLGQDGLAPDVIFFFMGFNDWGCPAKPTPEREEEKIDLSVFSVAYTCALEKLKRNYPAAEILCFTLPVATRALREDFEFPYCYRGRHIEEYCAVIRDCAKQMHCGLVDLYQWPIPYDTIDGFHPNSQGMRTLSHAVLQLMERGDAYDH